MKIKDLNQRILNKVVKALLKQGCRSTADTPYGGESCAYRGYNGMRCAVGHLISNVHYTPEIEGKIATAPAVKAVLRKSLKVTRLQNVTMHMIAELQEVHDHKAPSEWADSFKKIAGVYDLDLGVITQ